MHEPPDNQDPEIQEDDTVLPGSYAAFFSFILGVLSVLVCVSGFFGFFFAPAAMVLSVIGRRRLAGAQGESADGARGLAKIGMYSALLGLLLNGISLIVGFVIFQERIKQLFYG